VQRLISWLPSYPVTSNAIDFVCVKYATNSPDGNQSSAVAELAEKPESSIDTEDVTIDISTFAHHTFARYAHASRVVAMPNVTPDKIFVFSPASVQWDDREGISVQADMVQKSFIENRVVLWCEASGAVLIRDAGMIAWGDATAVQNPLLLRLLSFVRRA